MGETLDFTWDRARARQAGRPRVSFFKNAKNETRGLCYTRRRPGTSRKSCGLSVQSAAPWSSAQAAIARSISRPRGRASFVYSDAARLGLGRREGHGRVAGQQRFLCRELRADSWPAQPFEQHQTGQRDAVTVFDDRDEPGKRASRAAQGVDEGGRIEVDDHADRRPPRRRAARTARISASTSRAVPTRRPARERVQHPEQVRRARLRSDDQRGRRIRRPPPERRGSGPCPAAPQFGAAGPRVVVERERDLDHTVTILPYQ